MSLMRRTLSAVAVALLLCATAAAQADAGEERERLVGPVREVRSVMTDYGDAKSAEKGRPRRLGAVTYDAKGRKVESEIYDDYGFFVGTETYARDAAGRLVESVMKDPDGAVMERSVYTYEGDRVARIVTYDGKGTARMKQVGSFAGDGRLRGQTYYDGENVIGRVAYDYDGRGNISEMAHYSADGAKVIATVGPCFGAHRLTYSYDERGRPVKVAAYEPDGELKKSWEYTYNAKGLIESDARESAWSRTLFVYEYEYDAHGNWVKQTATVSDRLKLDGAPRSDRKRVTVRQITYY